MSFYTGNYSVSDILRGPGLFEAASTKNGRNMHGFQARMPICQLYLRAFLAVRAEDELANAMFHVTKAILYRK